MISFPSGEKIGLVSRKGLLVKFLKPVPSGLMVRISELPLTLPEKAIRELSGDQSGSRANPERRVPMAP